MTASRFLTDRGEPRAFVIVASARSGTNLLVSYLRQVSRVACFGEILRPKFPATPGWDQLVRRLDMPSDMRRLHAEDATSFWELFLRQGLRRRRFVGAKVFYYHRRGDPVWQRFEAEDHRVLHLWRDATFDQYISRKLAFASGEWKADARPSGSGEVRIRFDEDEYLAYREALRADIEATREHYGGSERYVELEYRQLSDHAFVADLLERLFGERIDVEEGRQRQRERPKIEYVSNPEAATPYAADSIREGFASD